MRGALVNGLLNAIVSEGVVDEVALEVDADVVEVMDEVEAEVMADNVEGFEFGALQLIERFISEGRRIRYGPYNSNQHQSQGKEVETKQEGGTCRTLARKSLCFSRFLGGERDTALLALTGADDFSSSSCSWSRCS